MDRRWFEGKKRLEILQTILKLKKAKSKEGKNCQKHGHFWKLAVNMHPIERAKLTAIQKMRRLIASLET
jgi:hypothetical protein